MNDNDKIPEHPISADKQKSAEASSSEIVTPADLTALVGNPKMRRALEIMLISGTSPLMPPSLLAEYGRHYPELVPKIIQWTEDQKNHRQNLENTRVNGIERRLDRGQIGAAFVSVIGLCLSAFVGTWGSPTVASIIAIVAIGGPTSAVILASRMGSGRKATTPSQDIPATTKDVPDPPAQ